MEIIRWSPFREFTDLRREMDQIFNEFFERRVPPAKKERIASETAGHFLPLDIYEKDEDIIIKAGIPGVNKEDLLISLLGNTLTIRGERKRDDEVKYENYYHLEQYYGSISRSVAIPVEVDPEGMASRYQDGILTVILPKVKKRRSGEIKVRVL